MRYNEIIENMDHDKDGGAVEELRAALEAHKDKLQDASDDQVYDSIDKIMTRIARSHSISGQKLHDMWMDKYQQIPDTWIMKEGWKSAVAAGTLAAATAMGSPVHAAGLSDFVAKISMQVNGQTIKKEIKLGSDYRSADDARTAVEKFLAKKGVNNYTVHIERVLDEAFDQPYSMKWEKSEADESVDALVRLPDGTNLSIMFNMDYDEEGEEVVQVEFHRNNSQEVTGEGDAQRIFATVLAAIQQYIKKHKPKRLSFSASKEVDMDADDVEKFNPESRAKLYDRLVQRYARAWGYRAFRADTGSIVRYELSRLAKGVAEGSEEITEYRDRMYQYIKSIVPGFPDYVVKDWLYANFAKGETYNKEKGWSFATVGKDIPNILKDMGLSVDTKWQLVPNMKFTMSMWEPKTLKRLQARAGGSSKSADPDVHIPARDAERHTTQASLAKQQGGVRKEPVILLKTSQGYELMEGWHRTIQHFAMYPDGYTGPAYVAVAGPMQENFHDGKHPEDKGDSKRYGVPTKSSVSTLRKVAKQGGRKGQLAHWMANMKAGRDKKK
jgi:hypothetical protein